MTRGKRETRWSLAGRQLAWAILSLALLSACGDSTGPEFTSATGPFILTSTVNDFSDIYTMNADGTGQVRVASGLSTFPAATWSPDRTQIAHVRDRNGIYLMNADGSEVREICRADSFSVIHQLDWSPDGEDILFGGSLWAPIGRSRLTIWAVPSTGGEGREVLYGGSYPSWSPDGRRMSYVTFADGDAELHVANADGSDVRQLTTGGTFFGGSQWSPTDGVIAFTSRAAGPIEVWVIDAAGGTPRRVTDATGTLDCCPVWSPDGVRLAFKRSDVGLLTILPDGTDQRFVADPEFFLSQVAW